LLNQTPYLGTSRRDFLGDLGSANNDSSVLHQQTHDAAQPQIGGLWLVRGWSFSPRRRLTSFAGFRDAEIMRELRPNNNRS
jgi:hypothetical protein